MGPAITVAVVATTAATPPSAAPIDGVSGMRASNGACASHESGPTTRRILPSEMSRNARTYRGSNCVPELRTSSARASVTLPDSLYDREDVITS